MLLFIKKYPMSILLAIIALNLFSIAGSLKETSKYHADLRNCAKYLLTQDEKYSKKIGMGEIKDKYCRSLRIRISVK